jgi:chromosome segregation ATPase
VSVNVSDREALLMLNRDFQQLAQRFTEVGTQLGRLEEQLRRGGERFAKIGLHEQKVDTQLEGLRTDYSRAMAEVERVQVRVRELDTQLGATMRLANKVQMDQTVLQGQLQQQLMVLQRAVMGDDDNRGMVGGLAALRDTVEDVRGASTRAQVLTVASLIGLIVLWMLLLSGVL